MLSRDQSWLTAPVVERSRTTDPPHARRHGGQNRGTPKAPRLARCWPTSTSAAFSWRGSEFGHQGQLDAHVVNYADDLVICCRPGKAETAMAANAHVDDAAGAGGERTQDPIGLGCRRNLRLPRLHDRPVLWEGRATFCWHTPIQESRQETCSGASTTAQRRSGIRDDPKNTVAVISRLLRGWCGYFDQGPVMKTYDLIRQLRRAASAALVGAAYRRSRTRLRAILAGLPARYAGALPHSAESQRPAKSEGLMERGKPGAGNPHARFDERRLETEPWSSNCDTGLAGESRRKQSNSR